MLKNILDIHIKESLGPNSLVVDQNHGEGLILPGFLAGFRIHHILNGGSGSLGYGSAWKCIKIQNVSGRYFSSTLLIIGFRNYRVKYIKTG